ncbi:Tm-1-like ATP-binding domain-containing protein [Stieleria sp. TO1_6]|uniref:Tm-1-like ATP-binding domain-containing protein n=1 Tax=Stieleria tagensis TaxID=2956795 RepID=UPI00209B6970|nr:Tm-1-like ATP-binding domain-containing protein [Stieleria tagensis]MCO8120906.1 Tm-1-like ATP-binding domain-containing protein [Stieleria tagensis]
MANIAVLGTLDTKGWEHAFVADRIRSHGHTPLLIDVGTREDPQVTPDVSREEVAACLEIDFKSIVAKADRGECVSAMATAASRLLTRLHDEGKISGVISLGGGGGTAIATAAMRALPIGFPKLMVSTLASGNTAHYLGTKDITMMPSIVDVAGLNRISKTIFSRAAGAICGMVDARIGTGDSRPLIVASMFGNTTDCVNAAIPLLQDAGYEVLVFHATGTGGRAMESLIESGMVAGVLDITTTEWADELVGGTLSAGPGRLEATAKAKIPSIVVPGCLDMVNFGERESLPRRFEERCLYIHNPQVTLLRTNSEECKKLGEILAAKVNAYDAPVTVLIPQKGISMVSVADGPFYDPEADTALFSAIEGGLRDDIELRSLDLEINDAAFAKACVEALLENLRRTPTGNKNLMGSS